jgi:hypothetical protein
MDAARVGGENGAALSRMADAIQQQQRETAATQAAFTTGVAKQAGDTAWGAVTLAADAVNAPIEGLTLGAYNVGATQRLQAQGQGMVEFAKAPIESTFEHFNQREQAIASAEAAGDTWTANEIRERVGFDLAGMATGVAGTTRLLTRRVQGPKVTTHSGSDGAPIEQSTTVIVEGSDGGVVAEHYGFQGNYWTPSQVSGRRVYQRNDLFDPSQVTQWRENGKVISGTNLERMASGRAPIGNDGLSVQLHHLTQTERNGLTGTRGSLAEISTSFHQKHTSVLHMQTARNPNNPKQTLPRYPSFRRENDGSASAQHREFSEYQSEYWRLRAEGLSHE